MKKNLLFKLFAALTLPFIVVACQDEPPIVEPNIEVEPEEPEVEFTGENTITINDLAIEVELVDSIRYTPTTLTQGDRNSIVFNIDTLYTITIDEELYKNGPSYTLQADELSIYNQVDIILTHKYSGEQAMIEIATYPQELELNPIKINNPQKGYYYANYGEYIFKLSTEGELVYFRRAVNPALFNRTEIDGVVYYSYLDEVVSAEYPMVPGSGSYRCQAIVMDENFQQIDTVTAIIKTEDNGAVPLDCHSFEVLGENHYLLASYVSKTVYNIPDVDSPEGTDVVSATVQEIKDGEIIFSWESTDHPELYHYNTNINFESPSQDTYTDYLHLNSVALDPDDGNILMSFRSISSVMKVSRESGEVLWVLGGVGDMFNLTEDQTFIGQHDFKKCSDGGYSMFNNGWSANMGGGKDGGPMKFFLDEESKAVTSYERYTLNEFLAIAEGSAQEVAKGHYVVGWGLKNIEQSIFSELNFLTGEVYFSAGFTRKSTYKVLKYDQ